MRSEAAEAGFYERTRLEKYPRIQILTIEQLLNGKGIDMPRWSDPKTFKKAAKTNRKSDTTPKTLDLD